MPSSKLHKFLADFNNLSKIGATPQNGVDRQAGTSEDAKTKKWFQDFAEKEGFEVIVDSIGNQFAKITWVKDKPSILIGSHLDSQPLGGRFDGAYGVLAGLHVAKKINDTFKDGNFKPEYNLVVVNWFNEEGARFAPSIMGSSAFAGIYTLEDMLNSKDSKGISVKEALTEIGYYGSGDPGPIINYAEIHIEQGRILDREKIDIGLVNESWYTQKLNIKVLGEQSHTGATAMADRKDALVTAAKITILVKEIVNNFTEESIVSSVGKFDVLPNSPIVVAREVNLVADLRSNDPVIVQTARDILIREIQKLALIDDIKIEVEDFDIRPKYYFTSKGIEINKDLCKELGLSSMRIATMAGHDAVAMNSVMPTMMIFIPSLNGVSHCEKELTSDEDMLNGLRLFTKTVKTLLNSPMEYQNTFNSRAKLT